MRVCLNMIVRDEATVIERCLESVKPHISAWCIVDTGSEDATRPLVANALRDLPGRLENRTWRNFAHNRTEALALAREVCESNDCDWILTIDADEEFVFEGAWPEESPADSYLVEIRPAAAEEFKFFRCLLLRASAPWRFEGAVHEDVVRDDERHGHRGGTIAGLWVRSHRDGARNRNPRKYLDDAQILKTAMSRNLFYLAQSYKDHWIVSGDAGSLATALQWYEERARCPGWDQETWRAKYEAARCREFLQRPMGETIEAYLAAFEARPSRAESLAGAARVLRSAGMSESAEVFEAKQRLMTPGGDSLFIEPKAYGGPDIRIGVITAPRVGLQTLHFTLTSAIASDPLVQPRMLRVFSDSPIPPPCSVPVVTESQEVLDERRALGGIYGTLNMCRALEWAAEAKDIAVTLEDDVMMSGQWASRAIRLLEEAEKISLCAVVSLHDMHGPEAWTDADRVRIGSDSLLRPTPASFANGSQGYIMRPSTARELAEKLRGKMGAATQEERKAFAMDVGVMKLAESFWFCDPCLLVHIDAAQSTWAAGPGGFCTTDEEHRAMRITRRFRP